MSVHIMNTDLEGQIEILKLQLHNLEIRLAYIEDAFPKLRDSFAGFKGQMDAIQSEIPLMKARHEKQAGSIAGMGKKVERLYEITVKKYKLEHPYAKIHEPEKPS